MMNSRQRVRAVLNGEIPDRVPLGLGGCETAGLHLLTYDRLNEVLGIDNITGRLDTFMLNAVFEKETLYKMQGDIILLASPRMCGAPLWGKGYLDQWKEQTLWGKTFKVATKERFTQNDDGSMVWNEKLLCPPGSFYFDSLSSVNLYAEVNVPDPKTYQPKHELNDTYLRQLEDTAKELYEQTEFSISCGETITDLQIQPGGFVGSMILMMEEPDLMHEYLSKSADAAISQLKQLDQAIGKYTDMLCFAQDFGDNRSVTIGDNLWREIYKPHYKKVFSAWHNITNMKINFHSCGSIYSILPDLIECGMDIYNPVQISANDMDANFLKEKFSDLIFYGGAYDAQLIPNDSDYQVVYDTVKENITTLMKNGNYIMAGVHNLPANISKEHLKAMLDAFYDSREY